MSEKQESPRSRNGGSPKEFDGSDTNSNHNGAVAARKSRKKAPAPDSYSTTVIDVTTRYLDEVLAQDHADWPRLNDDQAMKDLHDELLDRTNGAISGANAVRDRDERIIKLRMLLPEQVMLVELRLGYVIRVCEDVGEARSRDILAVYSDEGDSRGTYLTDPDDIERAIYRVEPLLSNVGLNTTLRKLFTAAGEDPYRKVRTKDPDLIPMNNCVLRYSSREILQFDPEWVFLAKFGTNLVRGKKHPVLVGDDGVRFNIFEWAEDLFDGDKERAKLVWQVVGAMLRQFHPWNTAILPYSDKGNNGKGTVAEMLVNIAGPSNVATLPLNKMSKDFMMDVVIGKAAIISDENDVGGFLDQAAEFKSLVTGDPMLVNRKGLRPVRHAFRGLVVQCLNELPRVKDKTDSFYRRLTFIPFDKSFTGQEKKWIKERFMRDPDLLEFIVSYVLLEMDQYDELIRPAASVELMDEYRAHNDSVREFWTEYRGAFTESQWRFIPTLYAYHVFKAWQKEVNPAGKQLSMKAFATQFKATLGNDPVWEPPGKEAVVVDGLMDGPVPVYNYEPGPAPVRRSGRQRGARRIDMVAPQATPEEIEAATRFVEQLAL